MSRFLFIGGNAALDLVNTEIVSGGVNADLLQTPADFAAWLREAGIVAGGRVGLREVKAFRRALRKMFAGLARGGRASKTGIDAINEALARGRGSLRLRREKDGYRMRFAGGEQDPLVLLAAAAGEFLATADLSRVRQCEGTGCILFFYDATKSHSRRWCSMAVCGNRMKAASFYQRTRNRESSKTSPPRALSAAKSRGTSSTSR